jgi:hypothetical protein
MTLLSVWILSRVKILRLIDPKPPDYPHLKTAHRMAGKPFSAKGTQTETK